MTAASTCIVHERHRPTHTNCPSSAQGAHTGARRAKATTTTTRHVLTGWECLAKSNKLMHHQTHSYNILQHHIQSMPNSTQSIQHHTQTYEIMEDPNETCNARTCHWTNDEICAKCAIAFSCLTKTNNSNTQSRAGISPLTPTKQAMQSANETRM